MNENNCGFKKNAVGKVGFYWQFVQGLCFQHAVRSKSGVTEELDQLLGVA